MTRDRLIAVVMGLNLMNWMLIYIWSAYFNRQDIFSLISFNPEDPPGPLEPRLYTIQPPFGRHYFGDLFQVIQQSRQDSPYISSPGKLVSQYPPFSHWLMWPLTVLPPASSILVAQVGLVLVTVVSLRILLRYFNLERQTALFSVIIASSPIIAILDRGNLNGLVFFFVVLAVVNQGKRRFAILWLAIAGALKLFPLVFIQYWRICLRKFSVHLKFGLTTAMTALLISIVSLLQIREDFFLSLKNMVTAMANNIGVGANSRLSQSLSSSGFKANLEAVFGSSDRTSQFLIELSFWMVVGILVISVLSTFRILIDEYRVLLVCAASVILIPRFSGQYQLVFLILPLVALLGRREELSWIDATRALLIAVALLPGNFVVESVNIKSILIPAILIVLLVDVAIVGMSGLRKS